jgi:hypothetical protein
LLAFGSLRDAARATGATREMDLLSLDDDALLAIMQFMPVKMVRGPLLVVSRRLSDLALSAAALGGHVDVAFIGGSKSKAVTPLLDALAKLNTDGGIWSVALGNHDWGTGTTKKLLKLFPALQAIDLGNAKKVSHHHRLSDWDLQAVPALRKFKWHWAFDCDEPKVMNLVRGREMLEELELECAEGMGEESPHSGLTDTLLIELGKNCPNLKSLALQGHLDFSDKGLDALLAGCRELEKLKLHIHTIFHAQLSRIRLSPMCVDAIRARGFRMACLAPYYLESSSAVVSWKVSAAEARTQDNAYPYA